MNQTELDTRRKDEFFRELRQYFENPINNEYYRLYPVANASHIWFEKGVNSARFSVRVKHGALDDISIFINGDKDKSKFDKLKTFRDQIEGKLGYKLVWDRNDTFNKKTKRINDSPRIGRFGKYCIRENVNEEGAKRFDFDLEVEKVAHELVRMYEVIMPIIEKNLK